MAHCVTSVYCRPPPRCSQSKAANGLWELGNERRGGRGGWAEGVGNPITETPAWTFPPPPTQSSRVGEGSLLSPARRGAEPGSGEETLSVRVVGASARGRAPLETVEPQGRWAGGLSWVATRRVGSAQTRPGAPRLPCVSF